MEINRKQISRRDFMKVLKAYTGGLSLMMTPGLTQQDETSPSNFELDMTVAHRCIVPVENANYDTGLQFLTELTKGGKPTKPPSFHLGWDIHAKRGEEVINSCDGRVVFAGYVASGLDKKGSLGNVVIIEALMIIGKVPEKIYLRYGHLDQIKSDINVGDIIKLGTPIGTVGSTGGWRTPHLHLDGMREIMVQRELDSWTSDGNWETVARLYQKEAEFGPERIKKDMIDVKAEILKRIG